MKEKIEKNGFLYLKSVNEQSFLECISLLFVNDYFMIKLLACVFQQLRTGSI